MATPKQFRRRGRWTLIIGTLLATLTFGAVMAFASSSSVTTSIPLNNNTASAGDDCPDAPGSYWHFVTSPNGGGAAFVAFHLNLGDATTYDTTVFLLNGGQHDNVFVQVPAGKTLTSLIKAGSSADITGDASKFQLSHTCGGASETSTLTEVRNGDGSDVTSTALALGSVVHDHAKVEADDSSTPEGTVDFAFYKGTAEAPCSGDAVTNENDVDLTNGEADSKNTAALGAGSYGYIVTYNSSDESRWLDSKGDCEPFTIKKAQLTVVTQIHNAAHGDITNTHVALGSIVHDTATLTGAVDGFDAPGASDVSFTLNGNAVASDNGNVDPIRSVDSDPLHAGSYTYNASVEGNDNYLGATSADEPLTVDKAQLGITTQIHDASHGDVGGSTSVPLGSVVHDTATVTGDVSGFPIGDVSFTLNGNPVASDNGNVDPIRSVDSDPLHAGSYTYAASVVGNGDYLGATSADEPLTVDKAQLGITTQIHDASHNDITGTNVANGSIVHDTATVTGDVSGFPIGDVSFTLNGNAVGSDNGNVDPIRSVDSAPLTSGSYIYNATVAGNDDYLGATSADEPLSVRTYGKTMGYWGNTNGQAALSANLNVTLGIGTTSVTTTCWVYVGSKATSKIILPNTLNGMSILTNCTTASKLDSGINANSMNTLLAQTLALSFNILYPAVNTYAGQTVGGLGCTSNLPTVFAAGQSLDASSTVQQARDYANYLIANAKLNNGVTITQTMIGQMNTLLGCLNREA